MGRMVLVSVSPSRRVRDPREVPRVRAAEGAQADGDVHRAELGEHVVACTRCRCR